MTVASNPAFTLLMSRIMKYKNVAEQVNQACAAKGCLPTFDIQLAPMTDVDDIHIRASEAYRFEGFGGVLGFPPKLQFWVHHMPQKGESVEIGRFLVPIGFGDLVRI